FSISVASSHFSTSRQRASRPVRKGWTISMKKDVWFAPLREIADHLDAIAADGWTPRTEQLPYYTGPQG
ncbi:MAG: hypothetical protein AAFU55_03510, partial [Pseudomonadota bacterium]